MSALSCGNELLRICFSVSWLNHDSTRFSQDASVGTKWSLKLRRLSNHQDHVHVQLPRDLPVDLAEEDEELLMAVPLVKLRDDSPI